MRSQIWLYLLICANALLTVIAALNLSANVFVLKASRFASVQVWSLDAPQMWLYYSPLLFPFWFWVLIRARLDETGGDATQHYSENSNKTQRTFQIWRVLRHFCLTLLNSIPRPLRPWLTVAAVLSLITSFPFAHIDLGGAPGASPDLSTLLRHYWQTMVIAGLARPGAILLCGAGIWTLLRRSAARTSRLENSSNPNARGYFERNATRIWFAALLGAVLLRLVLAGPAIPRLEDEVAYHVQALIFESGKMRGDLALDVAATPTATGISVARWGEILQLPYIFFEVNSGAGSTTGGETGISARFYSAHFHGWSAILAALAQVQLKPYANAMLILFNFWLFWYLLRSAAPGEFTGHNQTAGCMALFLFVCAPATVIMTGTYMSHIATQSLLLLLFIAHTKLRPRTGSGAWLFWMAGAAVTLFLLVFVRLQAAVPAIFALALADLILIVAILSGGLGRDAAAIRAAVIRLGLLLLGTTVALFVYDLYSQRLGLHDWFYTRPYLHQFFEPGCQAIGWGPGHGCFPTYGSLGHSFHKFLLNGFDRASELNQELSPAGLPLLPIALLLAVRHWRKLLNPRTIWLKFALAFLAAAGVYSLYFHNGGESYRGRYLLESVFAFYLIFARLLDLELEKFFSPGGDEWRSLFTRVALILTPLILLTNVAFTIRGDYFSRFIQPYATISDPTIRETVISSRDLFEQLGERDPQSGAFYYPLEFAPGQRAALPAASMKAFLNLGYATLAATATRIDSLGFLRDSRDNILVGEATPAEIRAIAKLTNAKDTRQLQYRLPETHRIRRGLVRWILHEPELKRLPTQ